MRRSKGESVEERGFDRALRVARAILRQTEDERNSFSPAAKAQARWTVLCLKNERARLVRALHPRGKKAKRGTR